LIRALRRPLFLADILVGASAFGGGIAITAGADKFPPEWLDGSPFSGYFVPGLILAGVGLVALVAAVAVMVRPPLGQRISVVAGAVTMGWIAGELLILHRNSASTDPRSPVEAIYFLLGVAMAVLGLTQVRRHSS
jgi:hypothetical protein